MSKPAPTVPASAPASTDVRVQWLRLLIDSIPEAERAAVVSQLTDLLREHGSATEPKELRRGKQLLRSVLLIYKNEPTTPKGVPQVAAALEAEGMKAAPRALYNAVGYLKSRKIIQWVSPGMYRLSDGSLIQTDIQKGGENE